MPRLASYDIVFQEIPGEVTLALNLSGCPNRCRGCHSPHLWEDTGEELDEDLFMGLLERYGGSVTCVCFMGGDADPLEVERLSCAVKQQSGGRLKTGWYSGKSRLPEGCAVSAFDFIKLGPYIPELGGLDKEATNQRFYRVENGQLVDRTDLFRKKKVSL